jgi:hypothetical protein
MSKVISFRLNPNNSREAEALTILDDWLSQGFSTRHTLTEAILRLDSDKSRALDNGTLNDLSHQIQELLARVEMVSTQKIRNDDIPSKRVLSDGFISSILKATKPGLKLNS